MLNADTGTAPQTNHSSLTDTSELEKQFFSQRTSFGFFSVVRVGSTMHQRLSGNIRTVPPSTPKSKRIRQEQQSLENSKRSIPRRTFASYCLLCLCTMFFNAWAVQSLSTMTRMMPYSRISYSCGNWCKRNNLLTRNHQKENHEYQSMLHMSVTASTDGGEQQMIPPEQEEEKPYQHLFSLQLPEGRCVGLRLNDVPDSDPNALTPQAIQDNTNHWIHNELHPQEVAFGLQQPSESSRQTFYLGRLAMRQALIEKGLKTDNCIIVRDEYGRPTVPKGYLGSISHKDTTGVALVASDQSTSSKIPMGVGVDIERAVSNRKSVAKRVLTPRELQELGNVEGVTKEEEVLLRFSIKESLYKASHPLICQYVGFQEAEVTPHANGTASARFYIKSGAHERFDKVTAHWQRVDCGNESFFLSSVSITIDQSESGPCEFDEQEQKKNAKE